MPKGLQGFQKGNQLGLRRVKSAEELRKIRLAHLGRKHTEEAKENMAKAHRGKKLTEEHKAKLPKIGGWNKGKPAPWAKNLPQAFKKGFTPWSKGMKSGDHKGIRSGQRINTWKGGITPINYKIRRSIEFKQWRQSVFERDDYRCMSCGERGGELQADHIFPFSQFPRLRFDINNGRTLCKPCHQQTETWGGGANKFSIAGRPVIHLTQ